MSDTLSVAMATYSGGRHLRGQPGSIDSQTCAQDEIVVCDDRSQDGTSRILEECRRAREGRHYVNEIRAGVHNDFERAIRNCTGDCIAISDQEGSRTKGKVAKSLVHLKAPGRKGRSLPVTTERAEIDVGGRSAVARAVGREDDPCMEALPGRKMRGCPYMTNRKRANGKGGGR